jgi:hypothetical protein
MTSQAGKLLQTFAMLGMDCKQKDSTPKTTIVNIHHKVPYDVYIGRGSKWGNPFKIGKDGTRDEVIEKYAQYIADNEYLIGSLEELRGKRLGCYCAPKRCHGDVLIELLGEKE